MTAKLKTAHIPQELRDVPAWVLWRYVERAGKRTKPPFQPSGHPASHSDPATWSAYVRTLKAYEAGGWDGIGFVLSVDDPYAGIDLDHCIDEAGELAGWAQEIIEQADSYAEVSPSGTGVRIFLRGALPDGAPKGGRKGPLGPNGGGGAIELYDRLRYLTVTGRHLSDTPPTLQERTERFQALYRSVFPPKTPKATLQPFTPSTALLSDTELLRIMFVSKAGGDILRLWNGDTSGHADDDSAADLALCNHLAFWTDRNPAVMDRLFRQSRLMRAKWDEDRGGLSYGLTTIGLAIADTPEGYAGPSQAFTVEESEEQRDALEAARATAGELATALRVDPGAAFDEAMLDALGMLRALDDNAWQRARQVLQRARVSVRAVEKRLQPISQFVEPADDDGVFAGDTLTGCPAPRLYIPVPYYLSDDCTGRKSTDDKGRTVRNPIALAPILIIGRTRDVVTGAESVLLWHRWPKGPGSTRLVNRAAALNSRDLAKLADYGFPCGEDNAKDLVSYLHRLDAANRPILPLARTSAHLGWQGAPAEGVSFLCGRSLILPSGKVETADALDVDHPETWTPDRVCFHGLGDGVEQVVDAFRRGGTYEDWLKAVSGIATYPKALLVFYAGLAAPLLEILHAPNFVVDMAGATSIGKTSAMHVAASHWGNPDERSACSVVQTWDGSRVGLERVSEALSSLPLFVDDTKRAKAPKMVSDLIYSVVSGKGRVRGTLKGLASTATWRTIMFSTGEQPATSFTQDGGTRMRCLEIGGMPFGEQSKTVGRFAVALNASVFRHYGHSGPRFLSWVQRHRDDWPDWQARYEQWAAYYTDQATAPDAGRLAGYIALIEVAGELAHEALSLPWEYKSPCADLWAEIAAEAADAVGADRALEGILSWASANEHRFIGRFQRDGFREFGPPTVYGRWDAGDDWEHLCIYPTILDAELAAQGYAPEAIRREWKQRGYVELSADGKTTTQVRLDTSVGGVRRMVKLRRAAFGD